MAVQIAEKLQAKLGLDIGASTFHEYPTLGELQAALVSRTGSAPERVDVRKQDTLPPTESDGIQGAPSPAADFGYPPAVGQQSGLFEVLLSAIATETGAEPSDIDADFTALSDLGVDSIMAMQITTAVREQTGIDLHPSILVQNPTIGSLRRTLGQDQLQQEEQKSTRAASGSSTMTSGYVSVEPVRTPSPATSTPVMVDPSTIPSVHSLPPPSAFPDVVPPLAPAATPKVNVVLMQGRKSSGHVPLFMFPDGAGSASTYMYLKRFRNDRPLYVLESPYLHNPQDFTVGVEEVSTHFKQAVLDVHPTGNFLLAGYSGGAIYAYETARQLILDGHVVQGLLLFDMAVPRLRPDPGMPPAMSLLLPPAMVKARNWADPAVMRKQQMHMAQMVRTVAEYEPVPMPPGRRPRRTWLTWCKHGVIERLDDAAHRQLRQSGILTEAIPDFMEDPAVGPFAWAIPPGKPLGPNGWDKLVGNVRCTSIDADHFTMIIPPDVGV